MFTLKTKVGSLAIKKNIIKGYRICIFTQSKSIYETKSCSRHQQITPEGLHLKFFIITWSSMKLNLIFNKIHFTTRRYNIVDLWPCLVNVFYESIENFCLLDMIRYIKTEFNLFVYSNINAFQIRYCPIKKNKPHLASTQNKNYYNTTVVNYFHCQK